MVAVSFGSYATSLFIGADAGAGWDNVFTSLVVLGALALNLVGSQVVDRAQTAIVIVELAVFAVFIVVTFGQIDWNLLAPSGYPPLGDIIAAVALTFFAFLGFSVISFSAGDLADPRRGLPTAMYTALGVAGGLYVLISLSVFGTLTVPQVVGYGATAIAEAARPALGDAGFVMMAIAATLATASSVNATLYASGGLTRMLASVGQFPPVFGRQTRRGAHIGLLITAGLVLVVANLVDLSAIASVGSAIALVVFVLVAFAGYRLRQDTGAQPVVAIAAIAVSATVLAFFAVGHAPQRPGHVRRHPRHPRARRRRGPPLETPASGRRHARCTAAERVRRLPGAPTRWCHPSLKPRRGRLPLLARAPWSRIARPVSLVKRCDHSASRSSSARARCSRSSSSRC